MPGVAAKSGRDEAPLLSDSADQLRLAHLRASIDSEFGGLTSQLGDDHRSRSAAGALRGPALAGGRLGALTPERGARLPRELCDRLFLPRTRLGPLDVLACRLTLFLGSHSVASSARLLSALTPGCLLLCPVAAAPPAAALTATTATAATRALAALARGVWRVGDRRRALLAHALLAKALVLLVVLHARAVVLCHGSSFASGVERRRMSRPSASRT